MLSKGQHAHAADISSNVAEASEELALVASMVCKTHKNAEQRVLGSQHLLGVA